MEKYLLILALINLFNTVNAQIPEIEEAKFLQAEFIVLQSKEVLTTEALERIEKIRLRLNELISPEILRMASICNAVNDFTINYQAAKLELTKITERFWQLDCQMRSCEITIEMVEKLKTILQQAIKLQEITREKLANKNYHALTQELSDLIRSITRLEEDNRLKIYELYAPIPWRLLLQN